MTTTTSPNHEPGAVAGHPPAPPPAILVRDLTKRYGDVAAVDRLSLSIPTGSVFGLVGPNGAGKTTTMLALVTLLVPDEGVVQVHGVDALAAPRDVRSIVGWMPDFFGIYDGLTCAEYLAFFAAAHGLPRERHAGQVADLLELVGLDHKADVDVSGLSRGMQQRLSLARALVHDPQVLVLDEPASGLDPRARVDLREILRTLGEMDHTILVSSHILSELEELCDRVGIIEAGRVLASGTPDEIRAGVAATTTVRIRLLAPVEALASHQELAARAVAQAGAAVVETRGAQLRAEVPGGAEQVAAVLAALVRAGLQVVDFREEAGGLERLFMSVTEGIVR